MDEETLRQMIGDEAVDKMLLQHSAQQDQAETQDMEPVTMAMVFVRGTLAAICEAQDADLLDAAGLGFSLAEALCVYDPEVWAVIVADAHPENTSGLTMKRLSRAVRLLLGMPPKDVGPFA